eukprot:6260178-Lingulodinium_polyedra.AAC.1
MAGATSSRVPAERMPRRPGRRRAHCRHAGPGGGAVRPPRNMGATPRPNDARPTPRGAGKRKSPANTARP